jgi:RNA polymerase sigma-70 factor (ECF subfamily)
MARYCDGDVASFRALYAAAAPRLLAYLRCFLHDRAAAEDILQQSFLKLHGAREVYVRGADPIPWLYAIAHRTCLDELRRRRRARVRLVRRDDGDLPEVEATFGGASLEGEAREPFCAAERAAVLEALDELPEDNRTALVLTKIQGLSVGEAAQILGITEGALKLRAHRGYLRLREILGEDEMFAERIASKTMRAERVRELRAARCA